MKNTVETKKDSQNAFNYDPSWMSSNIGVKAKDNRSSFQNGVVGFFSKSGISNLIIETKMVEELK